MSGGKYLFLGSSYIGAVLRAAKDAGRTEVDFAGSGGQDFHRFEVSKDSVLTGFLYSSNGQYSIDLSIYDHIFIYHDFPDPALLLACLGMGEFSAALTDEYLDERISDNESIALAKKISRYIPDEKITLIPENLTVDFAIPHYLGSQMVAEELARRLPYGLGLFKGKIYATLDQRTHYYKDSLYLFGTERNAMSHPAHDDCHFNQKAGAMMLVKMDQYLHRCEGC